MPNMTCRNGKITNTEHQEISPIGKSLTVDELNNLVEKRLLTRIGETGRGIYYELQRNDR
jgi:predicted HTH transcriptional regulator